MGDSNTHNPISMIALAFSRNLYFERIFHCSCNDRGNYYVVYLRELSQFKARFNFSQISLTSSIYSEALAD